ncbi:MAG: glycoside hydrolase family 16 protein, partial [Bacteroidota bacterium]
MKRLLLPLVLIVFVQGYSQPYEGAEIRSKQQFQYGKFSALIKVDRGSGLINAFFTYYNDSWQNGEYWREIDWEVLGRNTKKPSHAIHFGNGNGVNGSLHQQRYIMDQGMEGNVSQSLHQDYYWYTIEWTPSRITRYIHTKDWSQNI